MNWKYPAVLVVIVILAVFFVSCTPLFVGDGDQEVSQMGICVHSLSEEEAKLAKESGAGWIRVDAGEKFGEAVENAQEYDLKVLGILDSWMFNQSLNFTLDEWKNAVTNYVSEYSDGVDAWEIWNEPAHPSYTLSVDRYFQMAKTASQIIREDDPSAKIVLLGGLQLWSGNDPHLELDQEYAQQLIEMNITQYGDAISVHAYPWTKKVEPWVWKNFNESLSYYRDLYPDMEVWVTETGHPVEYNGEDGQAEYMRDALQYFQEKEFRVFWYSLVDYPEDSKSFGLIENGTKRPAYHTLKEQTE